MLSAHESIRRHYRQYGTPESMSSSVPLTANVRIDLPVPFDGPALGENDNDGGNVSEHAGDRGDLDQALLLRVGAVGQKGFEVSKVRRLV